MSESNRRDFLKTVGAGSLAASAFAKSSNTKESGRVIGANDRINVAVIGYGGRGSYVANQFDRYAKAHNDACRIAAVCDVYEKRKHAGADRYKVNGYLDY